VRAVGETIGEICYYLCRSLLLVSTDDYNYYQVIREIYYLSLVFHILQNVRNASHSVQPDPFPVPIYPTGPYDEMDHENFLLGTQTSVAHKVCRNSCDTHGE
jgi:hypothetical protein